MNQAASGTWAGFGWVVLWKLRATRRSRRDRRLLAVEALEDRRVLAAVQFNGTTLFDQFNGGPATIFGVGFDDGEPDANRDGISDSSGVKKTPDFFGFDFDPAPLKIGGIAGSVPFAFGAEVSLDARLKAGFEYGYYVNGGSASLLSDGIYNFDVTDTVLNGRLVQSVNTSVRETGGSLFTVSPKVGAYVDLLTDFNVDIAAAAAFFGQVSGSTSFGFMNRIPLISFNRQETNSDGSPKFRKQSGAPAFDGKFKLLGIDPLDPLSFIADEIQKAREDKGQATADKQQAQREKDSTSDPIKKAAADTKINDANTRINNANTAETNSKNKTKGKASTNTLVELTFSPSQAGGGLIGASVDFGVGVGVPGTGGNVSVGKKLGSATVGYPDFSLADTNPFDGLAVSTSGFSLGSDADKARSFLSGTFDVVNLFANTPFGAALGTFTLDIGPVSAELTTASYNVTLASKINQDASARITGRDVRFKFLDPITRAPVAVNAFKGANNQSFPGVTTIDVAAGTPVKFDPGNREVLVEQELINQYTFSNRIGLEIGLSGKLTVLQFQLSALGAEVFDTGALYELEHPIATIPIADLINRSFNVSGKPVSLGSFRIGQSVADLAVTVTQAPTGPIQTGVGGSMQPVVFTAVVTNNLPGIQGPAQAAATNTVFEFELPSGYGINEAGSTTPGFTQSGQKIRYNIGTLASGQSRTFQIHALTSGRDMTEKLTSILKVSADQKDPFTQNNRATIDTITFSPRDFMVTVGGDTQANPDFDVTKNLRAAVLAANARPGPDIISFRGSGDIIIDLEFGQLRMGESVRFVNALENNGRVIIRGRKGDAVVNGPKHSRIFRFFADGTDNRFEIDGLTFEDGNGISDPTTFDPLNPRIEDGFGGAIYATTVFGTNIEVDIRNSVFRNNTTKVIANSSGGAIATLNAKVTMENVLFEGNSSFFGGAASLTNVVDGHLKRITFDRNTAENSGGAFDTFSEFIDTVYTNTVLIEESVFTGNKAGRFGAAIFNETVGGEDEDLGGVVFTGPGGGDSTLTFKSNLFTNNGALDPTRTVPDISSRDNSENGVIQTISQGNNFSEDPTILFTNPTDKRGVATGIVFDKTSLSAKPDMEGVTVAGISVVHPFARAPFSYAIEELQPGGAFLPSDKFEVVDGALKLKTNFAFNLLASFVSLRITATDADGLKLVRAGVIVVIEEPPLPPTSISLSKLTVAENAVGAVVGNVTVTDSSSNDEWTFLVSDERFEVDFVQPTGQAKQYRLKLKAGKMLDFELSTAYSLEIQATDTAGLFTRKTFTITVTNVAEAPREVRVAGKGIREGRAGDIFGAVFVIDPDKNDTHTLTVNDSRFEIVNGFLKLKGNVELRFSDAAVVNVKVTATDKDGLARTVDVAIPVIDNTKPNRGNVVQVFRSFNPNANFHFFTTNRGQFEFAVDAGYRDEAEGNPAFSIHSEPIPGSTALFRLYNLERGFHYYTANQAEAEGLAALVPAPTTGPDTRTTGWRFEGIEGYMYGSAGAQTTILYRLYNNDSGTHLFTVDQGQRDAILAAFPGVWVEHSPVGFAFNLQANGVLPGLDNFTPPTTSAASSANAVAAPASALATVSPATMTSHAVVGAPDTLPEATDLDVGLIRVDTTKFVPVSVTPAVSVDDTGDAKTIASGPISEVVDETGSLDQFWSEFDSSAFTDPLALI